MSFSDIFFANMMTVMFVYGLILQTRAEKSGEDSLLALMCIGFPLALFLLSLFFTEPLPPQLDALRPQGE